MLRWQTAGESHGEALVAMMEGLPAGVAVSTKDIESALARRRLGYGRGARMGFEQDKVRLLTGVRHGRTLGSPVAIEIGNTEWPKWERIMSVDELPADQEPPATGRNAPLTRPRPGHADLTGMRKYGFTDARPVLERSSARETASRVALGAMRINTKSSEEAAKIVQTALDAGIDYFDTADCYHNGESSRVLGRALKDLGVDRSSIGIQTKVGIFRNPDNDEITRYDFSAKHLIAAVDQELENLHTDYVDYLLLHRPDTLVELDQLAEAFNTMQTSGKVRHFGV
ncbi:MAG: chorismate synthase, partial [Bifidobacterium sp.]|nr:chorismate synthase [Bifidobacterium sp.]